MQKHLLRWEPVLMVALGLWVLMGWLSSAEAVITIRSAEVVNGAAVVQGGNAARGAGISWDGIRVTQANNGGNFAFQGVVPADCVGRLEDGVPADAVDVALANCAPISEALAPVPQTGQTQCWDSAGVPIPCDGTGQDGDVQAGVAWPSPRFTDNLDGTVTDNLTGLIWLQDANCDFFGALTWRNALNAVNALADGTCGLTDGSGPGDWRLPNKKELLSLIDDGQYNPALPTGHPFLRVGPSPYWSSTTRVGITDTAWTVVLLGGEANARAKNTVGKVWPVRKGN